MTSVRSRLALLLVVPFAICAVLMAGFYWSTRVSQAAFDTALAWREHAMSETKVQAAADAYVANVEIALVSGSADTERVLEARRVAEREIASSLLHAKTFDPEEQKEEAELAAALQELFERGSIVVKSHDANQLGALRSYFAEHIATATRARVDEEMTGSIHATAVARVRTDRIELVAVGSATILMVIGLALCWRLATALRRSLASLTDAARRVAAGDLATAVAVAGTDELAHVGNAFNTMAAHLRNTMVNKSELERTNTELAQRGDELNLAVAEIRKTREDLIGSSRLAAIGDMAGRTAHEILNPAQSLHGRLSRMATSDVADSQHNADVLAAIVDAWQAAWALGPTELQRMFAEPVGTGTALEADLAALVELGASNRQAATRVASDVEFLTRELDRIIRIVEGMRNLSRQTSTIARHSLAPILAEACDILHDRATKQCIELTWFECDEVIVELDRYELLQVLTNVVRNAMQAIELHTPRDGGRVELRADVRNGRVFVEVRDNGGGIAPEHLPLIFDSTFTTRNATEGTGLGLSISRRLVRQMHGDLLVLRTGLGAGTTFLIDLPIALSPSVSEANYVDDRSNAA